MATLLITHDLAMAAEYCDRIVVRKSLDCEISFGCRLKQIEFKNGDKHEFA